jgi:PKD repeat protein
MVVQGRVYDDVTGSPIRHHEVIVAIDSISYLRHVLTDKDGFYRDSILGVSPGMLVRISTLDCDSVQHSQSTYTVPTPVTVNFEICGPPVTPCHAQFYSVLDSTAPAKNTFAFFDLSSPLPDSFSWNFGDGTYSQEQNPEHRFLTDGTFRVCLTILRTDTSGSVCIDSICREVVTPHYYHLGGHLFAGSMPINNPENTGDTGRVYLYRMKNGKPVAFDTMDFTYLGYFAFPYVLPGNYLIQARLTTGSVHYDRFAPTYSGDVLTWSTATLVSMADSNLFTADIRLAAMSDTLAGVAMIQGTVSLGDGVAQGEPMPFTEVLLFNDKMEPVGVAYSDAAAGYIFSGLPYGLYNLYAEFAGTYARTTQVWLDDAHPAADSVALKVYGTDVTGIESLQGPDWISAGEPFPNPAGEEASIRITSDRPTLIRAYLCNPAGQVMEGFNLRVMPGISTLVVPMAGLPRGVYFLLIRCNDGSFAGAKKILKK